MNDATIGKYFWHSLYVSWCGTFIRKAGMSLLFLVLVTGLAGLLGGRLPGGFLPEEDQGYMYAGVQLPDASSLQRTSEVCRQIEAIMSNTPGIEYVTTVVGMNMLSGVTNTYSGFFFVILKPWEELKKPAKSTAKTSSTTRRTWRACLPISSAP